jgi:hypothetical protein
VPNWNHVRNHVVSFYFCLFYKDSTFLSTYTTLIWQFHMQVSKNSITVNKCLCYYRLGKCIFVIVNIYFTHLKTPIIVFCVCVYIYFIYIYIYIYIYTNICIVCPICVYIRCIYTYIVGYVLYWVPTWRKIRFAPELPEKLFFCQQRCVFTCPWNALHYVVIPLMFNILNLSKTICLYIITTL